MSPSQEDVTRERFAATAERLAALGGRRTDAIRERLRRFVAPEGSERVLDVGTGTGPLAVAIAPLVAEVVGVDLVPEMLERARLAAAGLSNVTFVEGNAQRLPFADAEFDLVATARTIHHVAWPEVVIAEMTRLTRPGGRVLVVDQIASVDPLEALAHNRIERLRDPSHVRVLADGDFRLLFDANELVLRRSEVEQEDRGLEDFLDLAGASPEGRDAVRKEVERLLGAGQRAGIALRRSGEDYALTLTVAWYLLERPGPAPVTTAT